MSCSKGKSSLDKLQQFIKNEFPKFSDKGINTVFHFYDMIKKEERDSAPILLELLCIIIEESELTHEREAKLVISKDEISVLAPYFDDIIEAKFKALLKGGYEESIFYEKLWYFIWRSDIFTDIDKSLVSESEFASAEDKVRAYALYEILRDKRIPYYYYSPGLNMANEVFRQKRNQLSEIRRKIRFILFSDIFEQKTEKASLIIRIIESLPAEDDKTMCMVFVLDELRNSRNAGRSAVE